MIRLALVLLFATSFSLLSAQIEEKKQEGLEIPFQLMEENFDEMFDYFLSFSDHFMKGIPQQENQLHALDEKEMKELKEQMKYSFKMLEGINFSELQEMLEMFEGQFSSEEMQKLFKGFPNMNGLNNKEKEKKRI